MFFKSKVFMYTVLLQTVGPLIFSFGNWANIIQYVSAFGMAYAIWEYPTNHKSDIAALKKELEHLHQKHDTIHDFLKEKL